MRQGIRASTRFLCFSLTFLPMFCQIKDVLWLLKWYVGLTISFGRAPGMPPKIFSAHGKINSSGKKLFFDFPENRSHLNRSVAAKSETWHHWQLFLSVTASRNKTTFLNCRNKTQIHKKVSPPICWHCSFHSSEILSWHNLQRIFILTQNKYIHQYWIHKKNIICNNFGLPTSCWIGWNVLICKGCHILAERNDNCRKRRDNL